jgi:hypothetical protein
MDNHKGQTKYSITLNNDTSDIVKITRAEPGNVPGRWGSEKEVKLDSISEDIYGTSKHEAEKMYDEAVNPKIDDAGQENDDNESAIPVVEKNANEEEEEKEKANTPVVDEDDNKPESESAEDDDNTPVPVPDVKPESESAEEEEENRPISTPREQKLTPMSELKSKLADLERKETIVGEGRRTRKHKKRTTRKKNRKGAHGKSNKKGRKNTRGKR